MTSQWQPYKEPFRTTLVRTVIIAMTIGAVLSRGSISRWPIATLVAFWPSVGGHWVELWFLNWLRPRLPAARTVQVAVRMCVWFVGGAALAVGMHLTAMALAGLRPEQWPPWWFGGVVFIGVELVVHLVLQLFGRPSFYNGLG